VCDTSGGKCCGHDHVGGDELWLTVDELADLIADGVAAVLALPGDASQAERRAAMRHRLDEGRRTAGQEQPATRAEQREQRARARWGG
jgi:hypothetical protein